MARGWWKRGAPRALGLLLLDLLGLKSLLLSLQMMSGACTGDRS